MFIYSRRIPCERRLIELVFEQLESGLRFFQGLFQLFHGKTPTSRRKYWEPFFQADLNCGKLKSLAH